MRRRGDVDTTTPRFAEAWVPSDDMSRPWLPYEYTVGRLLYALVVDPFLALTVGFLYQLRKGYRERWHETYTSLCIRRRLVARDRKLLRGLEDEEVLHDDLEELRRLGRLPDGVIEDAGLFIHYPPALRVPRRVPRRVRAVQAAEALECPYQTAMAALDEVKTGMPDAKYKTIADALMLAHRAKRRRR